MTRCLFFVFFAFVPLLLPGEETNSPGPSEGTVWFFVAVDCPIANGYAPEMARLHADYSSKGFQFTLVYPEVTLEDDEVEGHRKEYALPIHGVVDRNHEKVLKAGATTTPEVAVFDGNGSLRYRGKIDDRYTEYGDRRRTVSETWLRDVLDRLLKRESFPFLETKPLGCLIEPLERNGPFPNP